MKTRLIILIILIGFLAFGCEIEKKRNYDNTYAIQNIANDKDIRVYNAGHEDETKIILYNHKKWECMTWELIELQENIFLLKNLYTQKTFEPSITPTQGVTLWQQSLGGSPLQYWEFLKQWDETYLIRLKDTELYITTTSDENNSDIILMPLQNSDSQKWRLVRQNPII